MQTFSQESSAAVPPGYNAEIRQLRTFALPDTVAGSEEDIELGKALISAWQEDGILQFNMSPEQKRLYEGADSSSKRFFNMPPNQKAACVDPWSYSGYIASGEEITDGKADYSEIFTVTKDLPLDDPRVVKKWPCHGRCPWPDAQMRDSMKAYMDSLGRSGEVLLQLIELGLSLPKGALTNLTTDGWHHMRILRFPATKETVKKENSGRGIGSHTDYGLLVIAAADEVGALFIRPPRRNESIANWKASAAGFKENDDGWIFVPPMKDVFTVFPGDMMQYMTNSVLPSTLHKVGINTRERFSFAYFHEPNFQATLKPLPGYDGGQEPREGVHYGKHFTDMFVRNYPERITTKVLLHNGIDPVQDIGEGYLPVEESTNQDMGSSPMGVKVKA